MKKGHCRETGNIEHTRYRTNTNLKKHRKKDEQLRPYPKTRGEPRCSRIASSSCFLIYIRRIPHIVQSCKSLNCDRGQTNLRKMRQIHCYLRNEYFVSINTISWWCCNIANDEREVDYWKSKLVTCFDFNFSPLSISRWRSR